MTCAAIKVSDKPGYWLSLISWHDQFLPFRLGSVSVSGTGHLDSECRDPVPDLETEKDSGPVPDPKPAL